MPAPLTQQSGSNVGAYSEGGEGGDELSLTRQCPVLDISICLPPERILPRSLDVSLWVGCHALTCAEPKAVSAHWGRPMSAFRL